MSILIKEWRKGFLGLPIHDYVLYADEDEAKYIAVELSLIDDSDGVHAPIQGAIFSVGPWRLECDEVLGTTVISIVDPTVWAKVQYFGWYAWEYIKSAKERLWVFGRSVQGKLKAK